jgi:alpha-2-macroglobulin
MMRSDHNATTDRQGNTTMQRGNAQQQRRTAWAGCVAALMAIGVVAGPSPVARAQETSSSGEIPGRAKPSYDQLAPAPDDGSLRIVSLLPTGRLDALRQSSEIRVQFDRPVVAVSAIDSRPDAERFVQIEPAIAGSFRWASTRLLVFTPDSPLGFGRRYTVTVQGVTSADGRKLASPGRSTFETPVPECSVAGTVRQRNLSQLIALSCSDALSAADVVRLTSFVVTPNRLSLPSYKVGPANPRRDGVLDEMSADAKQPSTTVNAVRANVSDDDMCKPSPSDRVQCVFVTTPPIGNDKRVNVDMRAGMKTIGGNVSGRGYTMDTFQSRGTPLIAYSGCTKGCDPDFARAWTVSGDGFDESDLDGRLTVTNLTTNKSTTYVRPPVGDDEDIDPEFLDPLTLRWAKLQPRTAYRVSVGAGTTDRSGQALGYDFSQEFSLGKRAAALSGPRGERVLERGVPSLVGFTVRNLETYQRVLVKLEPNDIAKLAPQMAGGPGIKAIDPTTVGQAVTVKLGNRADADRLTAARLGEDGSAGVYFLSVRQLRREAATSYDETGAPIPDPAVDSSSTTRAKTADTTGEQTSDEPVGPTATRWISSIVQQTDLGVTIRRAPGNALVAVTSIASAQPVSGATIEVRTGKQDGRVLWRGTTDAAGIALVDADALKDCTRCDLLAIASTKDDRAYTQSRWRDWGINDPAESFDAAISEASDTTEVKDLPPALPAGQRYVGALFADRGVYRLGDEVKLKGIVRIDSGRGLEFAKQIKQLRVQVTDNAGTVVATQTVKVSELGSFDLAVTVPRAGRQGTYYAQVIGTDGSTSWLITAFRNPDFKVDVSLDKREYVTGDQVRSTFEGGYLFGAPMENAPVTWTLNPSYASFSPAFGDDAPRDLRLDTYRFDFICVDYENCDETPDERFAGEETTLDGRGRLDAATELPVITRRHRVIEVVSEAEVTDVNRQAIANRNRAIVHPGSHYVGVRLDKSFVDRGQNVAGTAVAVTPTGKPVAGVSMTARLVRWEYVTAKRQTSGSSVSSDGRWVQTEMGTQQIRSGSNAVPFSFRTTKTGYYEVRVTSTDERGNWVEASTDAYVTGPGYVSWETPNGSEGSITLVPERTSYRSGETARILVQSPWENAEALVTTEGALVFDGRRVPIRGSSAVIDVPITDESVPNVIVAVTLYRGRTAPVGGDPTDPGRPMIRTASVSIDVPTTDRALDLAVSLPNKEEKPGADTKVSIVVKDAAGKPAAGEATIWAVDEGVLRLTGYTTPDLVSQLVQRRYDATEFSDSRMLLLEPVSLSRAKLAQEKGDDDAAFSDEPGGGGDAEAAAAPAGADKDGNTDPTIRRDFRTLAAWSATVTVGADGRATTDVKLPEQLTEFRVLAVASSGAQRFGGGVSAVRTSTPFSVNPAMPRFVTLGDTVEGGVVVQNRTAGPANVTVSAQMSGANGPLAVDGSSSVTRQVPVGATEVRFRFRGNALGNAKMTLRGTLTPASGPAVSDAVQVTVPVTITRRAEVVAASGDLQAGSSAAATITEQLDVPADVQAGVGGLQITTSSSALAGLQAGIQNLVEYPYGCLEQRTSRLKVLMGLRALGSQYSLPSLPMANINRIIGTELDGLRSFQTDDGGLAYWPEDERPDVYLTSRTLVLLLDAKDQGLQIPVGLVDDLTRFLQRELQRLDEEGAIDSTVDSLWWNQGEVLYALARAGAPETALMAKLYDARADLTQRDQLALLRAMLEAGQTGERPRTLYTQIRNGLRLEGNRAALDGETYGAIPCWCISYLLADDTHLSAELLSIVVRADPKDPLAAALARELVARRVNGTWRNTLEDGYALTALVDYGRLAEAVPPDLALTVTAGAGQLVSERWNGRSLESKSTDVAIAKLPKGSVPLTFNATGTGRVSYTARLTYARPLNTLRALDQGFAVVRSYEPYRRPVAPGATVAPVDGGNVRPRAAAQGTTLGPSTYAAGDIVRVTVSVSTAQVRTNVVIEDPLPAGFEAIDAQLESATQDLLDNADVGQSSSERWWAGIDRVEIKDDRVLMFATRLEPGELRYTYLARATAPGRFTVAPTQVEEMYRPEVFGRTATASVTVR